VTTPNPSALQDLISGSEINLNFGIYFYSSPGIIVPPVTPPTKPGTPIVPISAPVAGAALMFVAPIVFGLGLLNLLLAVASSDWLPLLRFLLDIFTEPLLLLFGKKRKPWGRVINSLTNRPLDLAFVRLYDLSGKLVRTTVTDRTGRFRFVMPAGSYLLKSTKTLYNFPSKLLSAIPFLEKSRYYFGGTINITEKEPAFVKDIPLDPIEHNRQAKDLVKLRLRMVIHLSVALFGVVVAIVNLVLSFSVFTCVFLGLHLIMLAIFFRLAYSKAPKSWGHVYDQDSGLPVKGAIIRIYDQRFGRLLDMRVANRKGEYGFLVGPSAYHLTVEAAGYTFPGNKAKDNKDYLGGAILVNTEQPQIVFNIPMKKI
jgi:hypothetical protein